MKSWIVSQYGLPKRDETNRVSSFRGSLLKMKRSQNLLSPTWGKRWFSIEGRYLRWYRSESDVSFSGMIDLRHVRNISVSAEGGNTTFVVSSDDRNLVLRSWSSPSDMKNWLRALHFYSDLARGGDGLSIVSDFNELPLSHQTQTVKRNSKSPRCSCSLELQLDVTAKKLDDLERELVLDSEESLSDQQETKSTSSVVAETLTTTTTTTSPRHFQPTTKPPVNMVVPVQHINNNNNNN